MILTNELGAVYRKEKEIVHAVATRIWSTGKLIVFLLDYLFITFVSDRHNDAGY